MQGSFWIRFLLLAVLVASAELVWFYDKGWAAVVLVVAFLLGWFYAENERPRVQRRATFVRKSV